MSYLYVAMELKTNLALRRQCVMPRPSSSDAKYYSPEQFYSSSMVIP